MTIQTINQIYKGEYKSLNSKFIGFLMPFRNKSTLNTILQELKKEHPKSCHICYAYRIGYQSIEERANDDGEPSGSAGKPILNQLLSHKLSNSIILVVRYFGGTKLGIPGLIEAYKEASIACLSQAIIITEEEMLEKEINLSQTAYFEFMKLSKKEKIEILNSEFKEEEYSIQIRYPVSKQSLLKDF